MEKTYGGTEQNMSEKQEKGQIMLHLAMKFENHVMNRHFFGNIISTRLKYTILKLKYIGK
jgi:hypothetical protein